MAETITIRSIWGGMSDETAAAVLGDVKRELPDLYRQAVATAAGSLKMRPQVLRQQPAARQATTIRRTFTQVNQQDLATHLLIEWLTKCQKPMLGQFLDDLGIEHEDGTIKQELGAEPDAERLSAAIAHLNENFPPEQVRIYLSAFSTITADDWQRLPELIA
ncbi:MAG: hypothetical protein AB7R89_29145 [Dehalococcoidia bacterium]